MSGVDPSQGMLDVLATRAADVTAVRGSGTALPFDDDSFELVLTRRRAAPHRRSGGGAQDPPRDGPGRPTRRPRAGLGPQSAQPLLAADHVPGAAGRRLGAPGARAGDRRRPGGGRGRGAAHPEARVRRRSDASGIDRRRRRRESDWRSARPGCGSSARTTWSWREPEYRPPMNRNGGGSGTRGYGRSAGQLSAALGLAGVLTYVFFGLASHSLSPNAYGEIVILWTVAFIVAATLFRPIEHLLARTLAERHGAGERDEDAFRAAAKIQLGVCALAILVVLAAKQPIEDNLFSNEPESVLGDARVPGRLLVRVLRPWPAGGAGPVPLLRRAAADRGRHEAGGRRARRRGGDVGDGSDRGRHRAGPGGRAGRPPHRPAAQQIRAGDGATRRRHPGAHPGHAAEPSRSPSSR